MDLGFILALKALKEIKTGIGNAVKDYIKKNPIQCETDKTMTKENIAADAKKTGEILENKANGKGITFSINESGGLTATYDDGN